MSQGPKRARAVAIALRRRRPQPQPDWMWVLLAILLAMGLMLARPLHAQTSVSPAPPERIAPTIPPGAGGDTQTVRPLPDTSAERAAASQRRPGGDLAACNRDDAGDPAPRSTRRSKGRAAEVTPTTGEA